MHVPPIKFLLNGHDPLFNLLVHARPALEQQMAKIRTEVKQTGSSIVTCDELRVLCPDEVLSSQQFGRIAEIAREEGWSFSFLPNDSVRFGSYAKAEGSDAERSQG